MTIDDAVAEFSALSSDDQLRALGDYAHAVTIIARDTYIALTEDVADPARLRRLNEVQHQITGHICHLISGNAKRYPDDVIVPLIVAEGDPELLSLFEAALRRLG